MASPFPTVDDAPLQDRPVLPDQQPPVFCWYLKDIANLSTAEIDAVYALGELSRQTDTHPALVRCKNVP